MKSHFDVRKADAIKFIRKAHAGQFRSGQVPAWHHLTRVAGLLEWSLGQSAHEGNPAERYAIVLAGLGHDTMEDTDATRRELETIFGPQATVFIEGMTNSYGDNRPGPYVAQVIAAPEPVRLVKLADLADNCANVTYNLSDLGTKWTENFFLPIVEPMISSILLTPFAEYPQTAERLKTLVKCNYAVLLEEKERFKAAKR